MRLFYEKRQYLESPGSNHQRRQQNGYHHNALHRGGTTGSHGKCEFPPILFKSARMKIHWQTCLRGSIVLADRPDAKRQVTCRGVAPSPPPDVQLPVSRGRVPEVVEEAGLLSPTDHRAQHLEQHQSRESIITRYPLNCS
jgi:hypothetical protein